MLPSARMATQMRWWLVDRFTAQGTGRRVAVSGERFASLMQRLDVRAEIEVPDRLGAAPHRRFVVEFERPRALRVTDLIEGDSVLRRLRDLGDRLARERDTTLAAVIAGVQAIVGPGRLTEHLEADAAPPPAASEEPPPREEPPAPSEADDLFARVEMPVAGAPTPKSGVDALVGALLGKPKRAPSPVASQARISAAQRIHQAVTATALDILQHPEVAGLEASWRGLRMLVGASPGHDRLALDLVDADLETVPDGIVLPEAARERPDAVFIGPALADADRLDAIARWAEHQQIPVVVTIDEALPFTDLDDLAQTGATPAWTALTQQSRSQWICAAMNPVVLVHEDTPLGPRLLGGSPAFALAAMYAAALDREAGLQAIVGPARALVAPAAHDVDIGPGERRTIPTAYYAPLRVQQAAAQLGVTLLGSSPGTDRVIVADNPMVFGPSTSLLQRIRAAFAARRAVA